MKKGFTLIELIVVIAIVALATGLIGSQFFKILGNGGKTDKFEKEVIAKNIADAAYVYIDSRENKSLSNGSSNKLTYDECTSASLLLSVGYLSNQQGLLEKCDNCIKNFFIIVNKETDEMKYNYGEKTVSVYYKENCTGYSCCSEAEQINY